MSSVATSAVDELRTTVEIRRRASHLLDRARAGDSTWFTVDDDAVGTAADLTAELTLTRFPDLVIPFHSRWRHFEAGGVNRMAQLDSRLADLDDGERARTWIDLAVISVLLDAGAGPHWCYREPGTGHAYTRSEGLGVASFNAFAAGIFSSEFGQPLRADADGLIGLDAARLAEALQLSATNPLVGFDGRVALLRRLGTALRDRPRTFGHPARPGGLFDHLTRATGNTVHAQDVLSSLLSTFSGIWLTDNTVDGQPLGDCWRHDAVPGTGSSRGWVPFHKLSQWLTYSLLEPFQWAGCDVRGLDDLTGLPEYRNGGLFIDSGALRLRDPEWSRRPWAVADELVVEWRALTVALLDELAEMVRHRLGIDDAGLPLACVLEGGTWAAGRALAQRLRGGSPPLNVVSDGTVF